MGGFQRVFEDNGGKVLKKLWSPLGTADLTPFIAQVGECDVVVQGYAGSAPVKFIKQYIDAGMKYPVIGGETAGDDALLKSFSDEAIGMISAAPYTADLDNEANKHFLAAMQKEYNTLAGQYAALLWLNVQIIEAALKTNGAKPTTRTPDRGPAGGLARRHAARAAHVRSFRQRRRRRLHPPGREQGRQARRTPSSRPIRR